MVGEVLKNGLVVELGDELGYTKYDYHDEETEKSGTVIAQKR